MTIFLKYHKGRFGTNFLQSYDEGRWLKPYPRQAGRRSPSVASWRLREGAHSALHKTSDTIVNALFDAAERTVPLFKKSSARPY